MRPYLVQSVGETNAQGNKVSILSITISHRFKCVFLGRKINLMLFIKDFYRVVHGTNSWGTAHSLKDVTFNFR